MTATDPDRPLRADARENREKLLATARERFAAAGPEASLEGIARDAGVGIATVYRHFPTREALIEAVYRAEVEQVHASAGQLLSERTPADALAAWLERFVEYAATKRGLGGALKAIGAAQADLFPRTRALLLEAIGELLAAGVAAGEIRDDIGAEDVLTMINAVWSISAEPPQWVDRARRTMRVLMDGLRCGAGQSPAGLLG